MHAAVLLFGLAGVIGKALALPPSLIVLGRVLFASMTLALIIRFFGYGFQLASRRDLLLLLVMGAVLTLHWVTFFQAIKVSTVAVGLIGFSTFPVFSALLEPAFFGERYKLRDALVACGAFAGVVVLVSATPAAAITRGASWGVLSGFLFAVLSILNRKYVKRYSGLQIAFYEDAAATVLLLPSFFLLDFHLQSRDLLLLIFLGVASTAVAHSLFIGGMRHVSARVASTIAMLEPVYGIVFALLLLKELPSLRTLAGGVLIVGAAACATILSGEKMPRGAAAADDSKIGPVN